MYTLWLQPQKIGPQSNYVPYYAQLLPLGPYTGYLTSLQNNSMMDIYLVKSSNEECGDATATVRLKACVGAVCSETTSNDLNMLYGTSTPGFPLGVLACLSPPLPSQVPITIKYVQ
jgi:hypothetical protein